jgi:hypothetical protein
VVFIVVEEVVSSSLRRRSFYDLDAGMRSDQAD